MSPEEALLKNTPLVEDRSKTPEKVESKFFVSETTNGETEPTKDGKFFVSETSKQESSEVDEQNIIDIAAVVAKIKTEHVSTEPSTENEANASNQTEKKENVDKFFIDEEPAQKNTLTSKLKKIFKF